MEKVKTFLHKWIINNLGFKILALVIAFGLWLVITNTIDPVTTRTISKIPVTIENEDQVLDGTHVYTVLSGNKATVVASGNRSVVSNLSADDFKATADFSELSLTNAVPITVELTGDKARYAGSVTLTQKTNSMVISLEDMKEKSLEVQVQFSGTQAEDMIVEDAVATPARVTLHAPETIADSAERAVALINYSDVTGDVTIKKNLIVYDSEGNPVELGGDVYLSDKKVKVAIKTNSVKTIPVSIHATGKPADGYELSGVTLSKSSVSVRAEKEILQNLEEIVLPDGLLNVSGQKSDVRITVNLETYMPEGVTLYGDTGTLTVVATIAKTTETEAETTP